MDVTWNVTCIECDMECDVFEDGPLWPVILKYHPDATKFVWQGYDRKHNKIVLEHLQSVQQRGAGWFSLARSLQ